MFFLLLKVIQSCLVFFGDHDSIYHFIIFYDIFIMHKYILVKSLSNVVCACVYLLVISNTVIDIAFSICM